MRNDHDPLWDPSLEADPELRRIERLLSIYRVQPGELTFAQKTHVRTALSARRWLPALAAGILLAISTTVWFQYRLAWHDGDAWQATTTNFTGHPASREIAPGNSLTTNGTETARITVARIGSIQLSPDSTLSLTETGAGRHRVSLKEGHMRARIWAPPGFFGVENGAAEVVDLGCDFDVWKQVDGSGRVSVRSGWVAYRIDNQEVLVPAGFEVRFNARDVTTPIRPDADPSLRRALDALERALMERGPTSADTLRASAAVAASLSDADAFTALSLLTRYPKLAATPLYPRLARALKVSVDSEIHRSEWIVGNQDAINAWWQQIPTTPKKWWANWSDVLY